MSLSDWGATWLEDTSAMICWARISNGLSGISITSNSPLFTLHNRAEHSTKSSRVKGNSIPFGVPSIQCPLLPTRCKNFAIFLGEANWITKSTEPISIPNSIEAVATNARRCPFLRFCSAFCLLSLLMLPWCALTTFSPSFSARAKVNRSERRRVLTNISVVLWFSIAEINCA